MKVRQHLQVSAEAFFAEIMTSICADIQKRNKEKSAHGNIRKRIFLYQTLA
jgi:Domain of unknown function (DUF3284).